MTQTIFLSTVSSEFGVLRLRLASWLKRTNRVHVRHQDDFFNHGVRTLQMLEEEIAASSLMIHVIGKETGWCPPLDQVEEFLERHPEFASLAVEYAWQHADAYSAVLCVTADSPENLHRNLAELTGPLVLNLAEQSATEEEVRVAAALRWLQAHSGWFLILDNVDTEEAVVPVEKLLADMRGGHVLITSRLARFSDVVEALELDVMSPEDGAQFLLEKTQVKGRRGRKPTDSDQVDALELATELDGLALAMEQAGAYIVQLRRSFAEYLALWRSRKAEVYAWLNTPIQYAGPSNAPLRSVAVTWQTTIDQLNEPERRAQAVESAGVVRSRTGAVVDFCIIERADGMGSRSLRSRDREPRGLQHVDLGRGGGNGQGPSRGAGHPPYATGRPDAKPVRSPRFIEQSHSQQTPRRCSRLVRLGTASTARRRRGIGRETAGNPSPNQPHDGRVGNPALGQGIAPGSRNAESRCTGDG